MHILGGIIWNVHKMVFPEHIELGIRPIIYNNLSINVGSCQTQLELGVS